MSLTRGSVKARRVIAERQLVIGNAAGGCEIIFWTQGTIEDAWRIVASAGDEITGDFGRDGTANPEDGTAAAPFDGPPREPGLHFIGPGGSAVQIAGTASAWSMPLTPLAESGPLTPSNSWTTATQPITPVYPDATTQAEISVWWAATPAVGTVAAEWRVAAYESDPIDPLSPDAVLLSGAHAAGTFAAESLIATATQTAFPITAATRVRFEVRFDAVDAGSVSIFSTPCLRAGGL